MTHIVHGEACCLARCTSSKSFLVQLRRIVVGKRGAAIGEIGIKARREMENIFQNRVHLFLDVVVRPN